MEFQERTPSELRWWEFVVWGIMLFFLSAVVFVLHMDKIAAERETVFMPFNVAISLSYKKVWIVVVIMGLVLCSAWMAWRSYRVKFGRQFWRILFCMSLCIGIVVQITGKQYGVLLDSQGVATMQVALDPDFRQEDTHLVGNLGTYGGRFVVDGETKFYICRQMDTFGPFERPILNTVVATDQPVAMNGEKFHRIEQNNLVQLCGVSMQKYQDGYWLVVKRFVAAEDLCVDITTTDDLAPYIAQMEYHCHRDGTEEQLLLEFEEIAGEAVGRRNWVQKWRPEL